MAKARTKKPAEKPADPATNYARDVIAGKIVAGRLVRLACERHLRDLKDGHTRGLKFEPAAAQHAIDFFGWLRLSEGEFDGKPFKLQPFQQFIIGSLFGWKKKDGYRRFRTAYIEIGKGSGKSPLAAGVGLYALMADDEAGAEVYSAATAREQAGILFRDAKNMVDASKDLAEQLDSQTGIIHHRGSRSFFKPVSSEHRGLDGKRVHVALIDELHEHPTALVVDKMRAGTKLRRQALIFEITNSGYDRTSVCWHHHSLSVDILLGKRVNDSWFAFVCGLDPCEEHQGEGKTQPVDGCEACDDWRDESKWPKANPNLGVSIKREYLAELVEEAKALPSKEGIVRRLNFCYWTESETQWLTADLWAKGAGPIDVADLAGRECYSGLDVASKIDVAAHVLVFPNYPESGHYTLLPRFWIPADTAEEREIADGIPWRVWARAGLVTLTPGNEIDLDTIEESVKQDGEAHQLRKVGFDPWNAAQISGHLREHGIECEEFAQNLRNFNEATKEFEAALKAGRLHHGNHPVLNWMAENVTVYTDSNGSIRPMKPEHNSPKKVDGIVASVMGVAYAMVAPRASDGGGVEIWE